jgi:mRNA interferase RelE/StbE
LIRYSVFLSKTAVAQLALLTSKQKNSIKSHLQELEDNPFRRRSGADIKRLITHDGPPLFRLRIGDYRAIYFVVDHDVRVTEIIHRSRGYRWLD